MKTTRHGDHLAQLTRFPRLFPVNCYLVRDDDGLTLIDTAIAGSAPAILAAATALGAPIVPSPSRMPTSTTSALLMPSTPPSPTPRSSSLPARRASSPAT